MCHVQVGAVNMETNTAVFMQVVIEMTRAGRVRAETKVDAMPLQVMHLPLDGYVVWCLMRSDECVQKSRWILRRARRVLLPPSALLVSRHPDAIPQHGTFCFILMQAIEYVRHRR